jgi:hypothetical protein
MPVVAQSGLFHSGKSDADFFGCSSEECFHDNLLKGRVRFRGGRQSHLKTVALQGAPS